MSDNSVDLLNNKQKRLQNKKRKLEAFFNIALMNDKQREQNKNKDNQEPSSKKRKISESAKKRRKKTNKKHGRDTYKKEIAELLTTNKKVAGESKKKPMLSEEEHKNLKKALHMRKKFLKSQPRFWIREHGLKASLVLPVEDRIPLFVGDVQHLVLFALLGNSIHQEHNRWCHLERHGLVSQVVVVLLEGVGAGDLTKPLKKLLNQPDDAMIEGGKSISDLFPHAVELISPDTYDRSLAEDISLVPLSARMCRKMLLKYGTKEAELKSKVFRAAFPVSITLGKRDKPAKSSEVPAIIEGETSKQKKHEDEEPEEICESKKALNEKQESDEENEKKSSKKKTAEKPMWHPADKFSRTELLLSPSQMIEESFAMPLGEMAYRYQHYVYTKDQYAEVTPFSPMFGLDCEMCFTTARKNELTRITIVNEAHESVYETLVMPRNRITNYLTRYSGITPQMMRGVKTSLKDVQRDIRKLLPADAILVGQSLNCDLHAIEMFHPYIIDSSIVFNIWGQRKKKTKLKILSEMFLGEKIQQSHAGHDSCEDASAALKLVQFKLSKSIEFGDRVLGFNPEAVSADTSEPTPAMVIEPIPEKIMEPVPEKIMKPVPEKILESIPEKVEDDLPTFTEEQVHDIEQKELEEEEKEKDYKYLPTDLPQPEVLKVMEASSLFRLAARTKKVGVFGMPEVVQQYSKYLSKHEMKGTQLALRAGSHGFEANNNFAVVKKFIQDAPMFDLAIAHLKMDVIGSEKQRARAINSCLKIAKNVKDNGVMIVVAGGRPRIDTDGKSDFRPACFVRLGLEPFTKL